MYAINEDVTFTFNLEPMAAGIPTTISLILLAPDKVTTFDLDGTTIGAVYIAPTDVLAGSYVFTTSFAQIGNWEIIWAKFG